MSDVKALRQDIRRQEQKLAADKRYLEALEKGCEHTWGKTEYTPLIREGYQDPGDPEGTMGIDRRLPHHVPREETPKWTRTCSQCGKTETTARVNEKVTRTPRF